MAKSEPTLDGDAALRAPCVVMIGISAPEAPPKFTTPVRLLITGFIRMLMKPALFTWA